MTTFFNTLNHLMLKTKTWDQLSETERNDINVWSLHRFISMYSPYIELANIVQRIPLTEKERIYRTYYSLLPTKKVYLKYIKGKSEKISNDLLDKVTFYFSCSSREAKDLLMIISKDSLKQILQELGVDDKEITKLIKF
jgi:hypothetical protein